MANYTKKKGKEDYNKHKDKCKYTSSKHKFKGIKLYKKALKKLFHKTTKAQGRAFLDSLNELEKDSTANNTSTSSDDKFEHKIKDKCNGHCFHANTTKKGFCIMALDDKKTGVIATMAKTLNSKVSCSANKLGAELNTMNVAFLSHDTSYLDVW
jgi:hypothetical protein